MWPRKLLLFPVDARISKTLMQIAEERRMLTEIDANGRLYIWWIRLRTVLPEMQNIGTFQLTEVNNFIIRLQSCSFLFLQWFTNIASLNDNHSITLFYRSTLTELPVRSQKSGHVFARKKQCDFCHRHSWCCFYSETVSDFFVLLRNKKKIHLYTFKYQFQMSLKEKQW